MLKVWYFAAGLASLAPAIGHAQGVPQQTTIDGQTNIYVVECPQSNPTCAGLPAGKALATLQSLASGIAPLLPQSSLPANVKVIYIPSDSGTTGGSCPASATCYPATGLTATNKVLFGLLLDSKGADLSTASYSFAPLEWAAIPSAVNPTSGWRTGDGVLIDPASTPLGDLSALFVYE